VFKRSITGIILVLITIGSILFSIWSAAFLFLIILFFSSKEWLIHFSDKAGTLASKNFLFIAIVFAAFIIYQLFNREAIPSSDNLIKLNSIVVFLLCILGGSVIFKTEWSIATSWYSGIIYICFPLFCGISFLLINFEINKLIILGLIIINWSNDVFAYLTGRLIGKHLMAPDISPKKTIEGAIGGCLAAMLAAFLINKYLFVIEYSLMIALVLGIAVWAAGTIGDLYESKMKRLVGIKDSGNLLPGHGGFLDRFDSFFFIIPVGIFVITILN
jgi:phosphatidate cytidylyltransferase